MTGSEHGTPSNAEQLMTWMDGDCTPEEVHAILEWLRDAGYLTDGGNQFADQYWERYLHTGSSREADQ